MDIIRAQWWVLLEFSSVFFLCQKMSSDNIKLIKKQSYAAQKVRTYDKLKCNIIILQNSKSSNLFSYDSFLVIN